MATMNRNPSQQDEENDTENDVVDLSDQPIDLEASPPVGKLETTVKEQPSQVDPTTKFAPDEKAALARGLTGAAPALLGFLFGASPATATQNIEQGQQYYANGTPKKLVTTVGEDGSPIYTDSRDAVGQKAYQKPVRGFAPGSGLSAIKYKDPTTGLEAIGTFDKTAGYGVVKDANGNIVSDPKSFQGPKVQEVTDEKGNKKFVTIDPTGKVSDNAQIAQGLGQKYGLREDEVKQGDQLADQYLKDSKPIYESKASLKGAINLLNAPDKDAITQAAGVFRTAKAIVNERISDQERGFVTAPPGFFDKISQKLETLTTNENPQEQLRQLRGVLLELDKGNNLALSSLQDRIIRNYSNGYTNKGKADYLSNKIVQGTDINVSQPPTLNAKNEPVMPPDNKKYEITEQQWNSMSEAQRRRVIETEKNKKLGK